MGNSFGSHIKIDRYRRSHIKLCKDNIVIPNKYIAITNNARNNLRIYDYQLSVIAEYETDEDLDTVVVNRDNKIAFNTQEPRRMRIDYNFDTQTFTEIYADDSGFARSAGNAFNRGGDSWYHGANGNTPNHVFQKWDAETAILEAEYTQDDICLASNISVSATDNVYGIWERDNKWILGRFDEDLGKVWEKIDVLPFDGSSTNEPGIDITHANEIIIGYNSEVAMYDSDGGTVWRLTDFNSVQNLGVDHDGNIYICDYSESEVIKYNSENPPSSVWSYSFPNPTTIGVDGFGKVVVGNGPGGIALIEDEGDSFSELATGSWGGEINTVSIHPGPIAVLPEV